MDAVGNPEPAALRKLTRREHEVLRRAASGRRLTALGRSRASAQADGLLVLIASVFLVGAFALENLRPAVPREEPEGGPEQPGEVDELCPPARESLARESA